MARKQWSTRDVAFLRETAGKRPVRWIAINLGISEQAVRMKAHREGISLALEEEEAEPLTVCPACGRMVVDLTPSGICRVCVRKNRNIALMEEQERLEAELEAVALANQSEKDALAKLGAEKDRLKSRNSWLRGKIKQEKNR